MAELSDVMRVLSDDVATALLAGVLERRPQKRREVLRGYREILGQNIAPRRVDKALERITERGLGTIIHFGKDTPKQYRLNGETSVQQAAGYALLWVSKNKKSLRSIFGIERKDSNAPYTTFRLLEGLDKTSVSNADLESIIDIDPRSFRESLFRLEGLGAVRYEQREGQSYKRTDTPVPEGMRRAERYIADVLEGEGYLTPAEISVLLKEKKGESYAERTISTGIQRLVEAGSMESYWDNPNAARILLTPDGMEMKRELIRPLRRHLTMGDDPNVLEAVRDFTSNPEKLIGTMRDAYAIAYP